MKKVLIKNSLSGIIQIVVNMILVFITLPVFIKMLGIDLYGIFSLVLVIGSLNTFTNLGLNNALLKYIAEQGRSVESNIDIVVAILIIILFVTPFTVIAIVFKNFVLLNILSIPFEFLQSTSNLFIWVLFSNFILMLGQVFKSILDGLQKIYVSSLLQVLYNILYWGLILIAVLLGYSLNGIGIAIFIASIFWFIFTVGSALKFWGKIILPKFSKNVKVSAKKQLSYGLKIYSSGLISFLYEPLTKILASHFLGVSAVAFYDIALRLRWQLWGLISKIFYPLFPFIAEQQDYSRIRKYVHDLEQKAIVLIIPIIVLAIFIMQPVISLWIGNNVEIIATTAIFIITAHLIGSSTVIPNYQFLMAKDHADKTIVLQLSNVFFNVLFFLSTVYFIGYYALIVGNVAAILSSFLLSLYYQNKYLNSLIFDNIMQLLKLILAFVILLLINLPLAFYITSAQLKIIMVVSITITTTLFLYKYLKLITSEDITRYFGKNNFFAIKLAHFYS